MISLFSNNGRDESAAASPQFSLAYEHGVQPIGSSPQPDHFPRNPLAVELTVEAPGLQALPSPRRPLNLGLAIDRSGSMTGGKLVAAIEAARCLVERLPDGSRLAIVAFDDPGRDVCASTRLDDLARTEIRRRVGELEPGRTTALFDGFLRAAELVAHADSAEATDSWVILLSDGQGNQGVVDPALMKAHAAELAARGIRTITIGIGADYQAQQLTALSTGGDGAFHHAAEPGEISEIVLGELKALGTATVNRLSLSLEVSGMAEWTLLGGHAEQSGTRGTVRFDRIGAGQSVRVVVLGRPIGGIPTVQIHATWLDEQQRPGQPVSCRWRSKRGVERDIELARRAAQLWHAHIVARAPRAQ
jgi:hypothetical protein